MALFAARAGAETGNSPIVRFEPENCGCAEVDLPEGWKFPQTASGRRLEFRNRFGPVMLVGARSEADESLHGLLWNSTSNYGFVARAGRVADRAWNEAKAVKPFRLVLTPGAARVVFRGLAYEKRGRDWSENPAMPSTDGGLIALRSHTGSGAFFLDFFDGRTGLPVCRAESGKMLEDSGWLSARQFVAIPAGAGERRLLSCRLVARAMPPSSKGPETAVSPVQGRIITLEERAVDANGNALTDHVAVTALVEVSEAGVYLFEMQLENRGKLAVASGTAVLAAGQGRISVKFPSKELVRLGDGPHERWNARF